MLQDVEILDDVIYSSNVMSQYCRVELPDFDCNSEGSNECRRVVASSLNSKHYMSPRESSRS